MLNKPCISVVIPFYNHEEYVFAAVENLKKQDFKDFEMILVNDGSTDNTFQKINEAKDKNPDLNIIVVNKENGGASSARNSGIDAAKGDWICFCDADDMLSSDYLSVLYNTAVDNSAKMSIAYITKQIDGLHSGEKPEIEVFTKVEFLKEFLYNGIKYSHCAAIFHRSFFDEGYRYPDGEKFSEDVYLVWKLIALNERIPLIKRAVYYYIANLDSVMNRKMTLDRMGAINLMKDLEPFIEKNAPEFYPEFKNYAVARHYWSILWQAAGSFKKYSEFKRYADNFDMKPQLKKLYSYPSKKITLTARLYNFSPFVYYVMMSVFVKYFK